MIDSRLLLLGSKLRIAATTLVLFIIAADSASAVGLLSVPSTAAADNVFSGVTNETTTVETDLIPQLNTEERSLVDGPSSPPYSNPLLCVNETRVEWGQVSRTATPIDSAFVIYNPKTQPSTTTEVGSEGTMNGISVGDGQTKEPYVLEGGTTATMEATTQPGASGLPTGGSLSLRRADAPVTD